MNLLNWRITMKTIDFTKIIEKLNPGDTVTVSLESSSGNVDSVISMNWLELF